MSSSNGKSASMRLSPNKSAVSKFPSTAQKSASVSARIVPRKGNLNKTEAFVNNTYSTDIEEKEEIVIEKVDEFKQNIKTDFEEEDDNDLKLEPVTSSPPLGLTKRPSLRGSFVRRNSLRSEADSDVSSLSQSTFQSSPSSPKISALKIPSQSEAYDPLKWSAGEREVVVTPKGYTPKAMSRRSSLKVLEEPEKEYTDDFEASVSKTDLRSQAGASSSPRSISRRTSSLSIPEPVLSPRDRAKMQAELDEKRRVEAEKLAKAEKERQEVLERERLERERLEAEQRELERLEALRLEEERKEMERLEAIRIENERIQREKEEAERLEKMRLEEERLEREKQERIEAERRAKQELLQAKKREALDRKAAAEAERKKAEEMAKAEAERKAAERAIYESKRKAEQDAARAKAAAERKAKEEAARQAEMERKQLLDAKREQAALDRKQAAELRSRTMSKSVPDNFSVASSVLKNTTEEEKRMLARARIEEERRLAKEKEQRLLERKQALDKAKADARQKHIDENNRRQEERKRAAFELVLAEHEKKLAMIAAKEKLAEDRRLADEAARLALEAEAERKAAEKKERLLLRDSEIALAEEAKAATRAKAEAERKKKLDEEREAARLETARLKEAAEAAIILMEQARAAETAAIAEANARAEEERRIAYELARQNPPEGARSPNRSRSGSSVRSRENSFTGKSSPRDNRLIKGDLSIGIGPNEWALEEEENRLKGEISAIEASIREAEVFAAERKQAEEQARRELEKLVAEELTREEEIRAIAALEAEEAEVDRKLEQERDIRMAAIRRNSVSRASASPAPMAKLKSEIISKPAETLKPERRSISQRLSGIFGFGKGKRNRSNTDMDASGADKDNDDDNRRKLEEEMAAAEAERQRIHAEKEEAARLLALEQEKLKQAEFELKQKHDIEAKLRQEEEAISKALREAEAARQHDVGRELQKEKGFVIQQSKQAEDERLEAERKAAEALKQTENARRNSERLESESTRVSELQRILDEERRLDDHKRKPDVPSVPTSNKKIDVENVDSSPMKSALAARPSKSPAPSQRSLGQVSTPKSGGQSTPGRAGTRTPTSSKSPTRLIAAEKSIDPNDLPTVKSLRGGSSVKSKGEGSLGVGNDPLDSKDALARAEEEGKRRAIDNEKKDKERIEKELAAKAEANRQSSAKKDEITKAITATKDIEATASIQRSEREIAVRQSGLQKLRVVGESNPLINLLADRLDETIEILMNFKCNKSAGEEFAKRLANIATIIANIFQTNKNEKDYKAIVDDLIQKLIDAKKFFQSFATAGFLLVLLRGNETLTRFEDFDHKIMELVADLMQSLKIPLTKENSISSIRYQFFIVDEATVTNAKTNYEAMKSLAMILGVNLADMNEEIATTTQRLSQMILEVTEVGAQRQLAHPAMKTFWRLYLNNIYKVRNRQLVEYAINYIQSDVRPTISKDELTMFSNKLNIALDILDDNPNHMTSVFELNQSTMHLDRSFDFLDVLNAIFTIETLKIFPAMTNEAKNQVVWGENMQEIVHLSLKSPGMWSLIYGPSLSGKTYRWLLGAHQLGSRDAVIWIDFRDVKNTNDMLTTIANQLSLSVLSLDDVLLQFSRLLDSSLEHSSTHCCIVMDHVNLDVIDQYTPFIRMLKKLQTILQLAVVVISSSPRRPSSSTLASLYKIGKIPIPEENLTIQEVGPLSTNEAIELANKYDVYDPVSLIGAARRLPGEMMRMQSLRKNHLASMTNNANSQSVTDVIIADTFSENETLCAYCLYYPLSSKDGNGPVFHKAIAWELCRKSMGENIELWNGCMDQLVNVGWLRLVGDEGFIIPSTSVLPGHPSWTFITEPEQWEIYYRYWIKEAVRMNDLLASKDQLLGCALFDSSRRHFENVFNDFTLKPPLRNRLRQSVVMDMVIQFSSNISYLHEYRFSATDGLTLSLAILRILCDGDETGILVDDRYWKSNRSLQPVIVRAAVNLGWFLNRNQQSAAAEKILQSALLHLNDADPINYAYALNKLAIILRALGKKEECLETHKRCLKIRLSSLGENHLDSAQSMNNIAIVLNSLGNKEEALEVHRQCLKVRIELLGEHHASTGDTYYNLATVLKDLGRKEETLRCYEKAKIAYVDTYGDGHSYVKDVEKKISELIGKKDVIEPTTPGKM